MNTVEATRQFVFNAMLIEESLYSIHKMGIPVKDGIETAPVSHIVERDFSPIIWQQATQMSSVYTIIYCIENTLRNIIIDRLSERKGLSWWDSCISSRIKKAAEKIKKDEEVYKYISPRGDALIFYTLLDDLAEIISLNWDEFSDIIPDQAWIKSRMTDLTKCRNIVMHTGILPQFEIERIESIARDFIRQLG